MNYIDIAILVIIAISMLIGWYRGFISTGISLIGYFGCLFLARSSYSNFLGIFYENSTLMNTLLHYTEGSVTIADVELAHTAVSGIPLATAQATIEAANMPYPLGGLVLRNIESLAFEGQGMVTITDYINQTIVTFSLHMICLLCAFLVAFIAFSLLNEFLGYVFKYPALKLVDGPVGGVFGFARGVFFAFFVFAFMPIVLAILPMDFIREMVDTSRFAPYFYQNNILFETISAIM